MSLGQVQLLTDGIVHEPPVEADPVEFRNRR